MAYYRKRQLFNSFAALSSRPNRRFQDDHDRLPHLPTTLALNDPFLQNLYGVVTFILDDHPYPATPEEFRRRTHEIKKNVQNLYLSPYQRQFLEHLIEDTGVTIVDLWQGSHIITLDQGYLYNIWSKLPSARPRLSSHYRQIPIQQYGINFRDHQLLFGKISINGPTWFQMEAHGFEPQEMLKDPNLVLLHGQDFLKYRIHRMNVGPFGFSPHTETMDPIILPYRQSPIKIKKKRRILLR